VAEIESPPSEAVRRKRSEERASKKPLPAGVGNGFSMQAGRQVRPLAIYNACYFSEELMLVNIPFRLVPRPLTAAMIAIEMPAAIRPYSMAVAPPSSARNFAKIRFMVSSKARSKFTECRVAC